MPVYVYMYGVLLVLDVRCRCGFRPCVLDAALVDATAVRAAKDQRIFQLGLSDAPRPFIYRHKSPAISCVLNPAFTTSSRSLYYLKGGVEVTELSTNKQLSLSHAISTTHQSHDTPHNNPVPVTISHPFCDDDVSYLFLQKQNRRRGPNRPEFP